MPSQLTLEEREIISQMKYAGESNAEIARRLGRHPSTVGRELRRNRPGDRYFSYVADALAKTRRHARWMGKRKLEDPFILTLVQRGLKQLWSPDQIAGRCRRDHRCRKRKQVGRQSIYNWIAQQDRRGDGSWKALLRFANKRRRRRSSSMASHSIAGRPAVVDRRTRFGDWEGDTIVGVRHRGALVTNVERRSGFLLATQLPHRKAEAVQQAIQVQFADLPARLRRTITFDRGTEFSEYEAIAENTRMAVYFADPSCPWQRGTNENTNGLLRQYFPKGTDFTKVKPGQVTNAVAMLNDRPRKRLNYRTPNEAIANQLRRCD